MKLRAPQFSIKLDENAKENVSKVAQEVQLLRTGHFNYADDDELDITSEMLANMVSNFGSRVRGVDLAIDYCHENHDVAAGWIKSLSLKNNNTELWAVVDWTPTGLKVLSDKEFRYLSAEFSTDYIDNESDKTFGPTLFGAGLTNRPFVKDMVPAVNLSEGKGKTKMDDKEKEIAALKAKIAELEGKKEPMVDEAMAKENADLKAKCAELEAAQKKAAEEKAMSEKKGKFDKMLTEGRVVEAQRDAFMKDDMVKFTEHAGRPNLKGRGYSNDSSNDDQNGDDDVQAKILQLAEKKIAEKSVTSLSQGIQKVLSENSEYREAYENISFGIPSQSRKNAAKRA